MTKTERAEDIAKRSGFSIETVNAVLKAERESILESLKQGEKVTLAGRCLITPVIKTRPAYDGGKVSVERYLSATAKPLQSLLDSIESLRDYEVTKSVGSEAEDVEKLFRDNKIAVLQLEALE
jgi:hypothetical protein